MNKSSLASRGAWPHFEDGDAVRPLAQRLAATKFPTTGLPWLDSALQTLDHLGAVPTSPKWRSLTDVSSVLLSATQTVLACVRAAQRVTTGRALLDLLEGRRARVAGLLKTLRGNDPDAIVRVQDDLDDLDAWTALPEASVASVLDAEFLRLAGCDEVEGPTGGDMEDCRDVVEVAELVSTALALDPLSSRRAPASQPLESMRIAMDLFTLLDAHLPFPPEGAAIAILQAAVAAEALREDQPSIGHITLFAVAVLRRCFALREMELGWWRQDARTRLGRPERSR